MRVAGAGGRLARGGHRLRVLRERVAGEADPIPCPWVFWHHSEIEGRRRRWAPRRRWTTGCACCASAWRAWLTLFPAPGSFGITV